MASGAPSTPAPVPSTPAPKSELYGEAQESEEEQEEWDMNSPHHCCEILESRFPYDDMVKCNVKVSEFTQFACSTLSPSKGECRRHHCLTISWKYQDLDDITSTRQKRMDWLACWGKRRPLQFMETSSQSQGMKSHEQGEKEKGASRATVEIDAFPRASRRKGRFHSIVGLLHKDHSVTLWGHTHA